MKTVLLGYNPKKWKWENVASVARKTEKGETVRLWWSCGRPRHISRGDKFFIMALGNSPQKGIFASGRIVSEKPHQRSHFDSEQGKKGKQSWYVHCQFERILNPEVDRLLGLEKLKQKFRFIRWTPRSSVYLDGIAPEIEALWKEQIGLASVEPPQEDLELEGLEGEKRRVLVNHRKREDRLREAKIREALRKGNGCLRCEVPGCGFDFFAVYGELGKNFAHVHHLQPLGQRNSSSKTRSSDLAIVCANCHAMIHRGGKCRPMKGLIKTSRPRHALPTK
jgi:hypothetical protein